MRKLSTAIGCALLLVGLLSGCDETTQQPEWGIYDGPACGEEGTTPPWTTMGGNPGNTYRSKAEGPEDAELIWGRELGPMWAFQDSPPYPAVIKLPSTLFRVTNAVVSGSGALYTLAMGRENPSEPSTAFLQVEQFGPDGARGWSRRIRISDSWKRDAVGIPPGHTGVLALTDDCELAVRTPYRVQVLDPASGDIRASYEVPGPQNGSVDYSPFQMRLMQWDDDGFLTTTNSKFESETNDESQYAMRFSRITTTNVSNGTQVYRSRETGISGGNYAPLIAQPSNGRAFIRNPSGADDSGSAIGAIAPGSGETENMGQLWARSFEDQFFSLYILGASKETFYFSAWDHEDRVYHLIALDAEDGETEWIREFGDVPGENTSRPGANMAVGPNGSPIFAFEGAIVAMSDDGEVRWAYETSNDLQNKETQFTTKAVGSEGRVYAVSELDGEYRIQAMSAEGEKLFELDLPDPWTKARILALGADGTLYVEALQVRGEGDDGQVQSKLFAFGDAE